jgi:cytochrome P450
MTHYPEVQKRAQSEIDSVVGSARLPTHADRESLPYLDCILKEVERFRPITPLVGRSSRVDDIYREKYIQAGSFVMVNTW